MARNTSVSLGDHFASFVDEQVESGRYGSVSDVVRAGLRLLESEEHRLGALKAAIASGMSDVREGRVAEMTEDYWTTLKDRLEQRQSADNRRVADAEN